MKKSSFLAFAFHLFMLGSAGAAHAQGSVAEQLFREGQKLIAAGDTHAACMKFADSERAEPALGTLIALAACHEREEKIASAWSEFTEAADLAQRQRDPRAKFARTHADALAPRVPRVKIELASSAKPVTGLTIKLGDKEFGEGTLGTSIPLDAGDYPFEARATGKKPWKTVVKVPQGGGETKVAIVFEDAPPESASSPQQQQQKQQQPAGSMTRDTAQGSDRRLIGFIVGGIGVATGIVAVILQASASSKSSDAIDAAKTANEQRDRAAYDAAVSERDDALGLQRLALIGGGVGIVAIGVGAFLVLSAPSSSSTQLAFGPGGFAVRGQF